MTARPNIPESQRRPERVAVALCIVMVAVLLAVGCAGERATDNITMNATATEITPSTIATKAPVTITPNLSQCQTKDNRTFSIANGDSFSFTGISPNRNGTVVQVWIFGKEYGNISNFFVKPDGSFTFSLKDYQTKDMKPGTYRIIFQYPRADGTFDISTKSEYRLDVNDKQGRLLFNINNIRENEIDGLEAANILEREIMKPGIEDTLSNITLVIEEPWIQIAPIGDHIIGDNFSLNGTTNLETGTVLRVGVYSSVCNCAPIGQIDRNSEDPLVFEQDVNVIPGFCGKNMWSVSLNSSKFPENEYIVSASTVNQKVTANSLFSVFKESVTTATGNLLPNLTKFPTTSP